MPGQISVAINNMRQERAQEVAEIQDEIAAYIAHRREDPPKLESFNEKAKGKPKVKVLDKTRNWSRPQGPDFGM